MKRITLIAALSFAALPAMAQNYYYVVPTNPGYANISGMPPSDQLYDAASGAATARVQNQQLQNELLRQQIELNRLRMQQR